MPSHAPSSVVVDVLSKTDVIITKDLGQLPEFL
jgi:hypothetical protein